jgi:putative Mg2+ transporter-C (MgtC) family protein
LPSRPAVAVTVRFQRDFKPAVAALKTQVGKCGYLVAMGSISISHNQGHTEWHFIVLAIDRSLDVSLPHLSNELQSLEGLEDFHLSHARN